MALHALYVTDPACPWSWGAEPVLARIEREFGEEVRITCLMGGLAREFGPAETLVAEWLDAGDRSGMPVDPRGWREGPIRSSFPACLAVIAAREQGHADALLRRLRIGLLTGRRKLDATEALVEEARGVAGLDIARFRSDLASSAAVEVFGADLERADGHRAAMPVLLAGDERTPVSLRARAEEVVDALLGAGAQRSASAPPAVLDAIRRHGPLALPEVAARCDLPEARAALELWQLAAEGRVRPERRLTGDLWHAS